MSSLSVNHNLMAYGVSRQLSAHYDSLADSVRRLSTGLRVERAADDAAGLAIRELMRADIRALGQGTRNTNDAISLIQTADGALQIIDEKLIRMKELAEQAATGTYDSTQRLMIDSEFQQMASEIDRIAKATDFNGVKLLDGSLSGRHDGSGRGSADGLSSTGALKVHFGTANDSAEDYYYVEIGDCTLAGLGLREGGAGGGGAGGGGGGGAITWEANLSDYLLAPPVLNDAPSPWPKATKQNERESITDVFAESEQGEWVKIMRQKDWSIDSFVMIIPKGAKNVLINLCGCFKAKYDTAGKGDNDIQLFTTSGVHLAGTPLEDFSFNVGYVDYQTGDFVYKTRIDTHKDVLGFTEDMYNGTNLNSGPSQYDPTGGKLSFSSYNGMTIGYSGDPDRYETGSPFDYIPDRNGPNDGYLDTYDDFEVLFIDEATEDLVLYFPGDGGELLKVYWDLPATANPPVPPTAGDPGQGMAPGGLNGDIISIKTQELAQQALNRLDDAIVRKDQVRAHLGATQNRLENTVTNLTVQAESLQAAESRISDVDVATEMTTFVRNQVLTQSATSMLAQANAFPHMLLLLLQG